MFGILKKEKTLAAPVSGEVIGIEKVPDQVFSQKIIGEGFAVIPDNGSIVSPANGTVTEVSETLHAYCITSDDGLEILVHIGIDTVELKGSGFTAQVHRGDKVSVGTPLSTADLKKISESGFKTVTVVVITNSDRLKSFSVSEQKNAAAGAPVFIYKL